MDGDGGGRFHTQTKCINRIIKFDSKQKKGFAGSFILNTIGLINCVITSTHSLAIRVVRKLRLTYPSLAWMELDLFVMLHTT
jgi:hypothetical protein